MRKTILLAAAALIAFSGAALADHKDKHLKPGKPVEVGATLDGGGIQVNALTIQSASTTISKVGVDKATVDTIAVGNNLTGTADVIKTGLFDAVQVNAASLQVANTDITNAGFGKLDVTTAAVGNNIALDATKSIDANTLQVNALTAQIATTDISKIGAGNLSVTTQAVGNAASFTVKK